MNAKSIFFVIISTIPSIVSLIFLTSCSDNSIKNMNYVVLQDNTRHRIPRTTDILKFCNTSTINYIGDNGNETFNIDEIIGFYWGNQFDDGTLLHIPDAFLFNEEYFADSTTKIASNLINMNNLPASLISIGDFFMNYCTSFNQNINIKSPWLVNIGDSFMNNCTLFNSSVNIQTTKPLVIDDLFLAECPAYNTLFAFPNSTVSIGDEFLYKSYLFNQPITIPYTVTTIGDGFLNIVNSSSTTSNFNSSVTFDVQYSSLNTIGRFFMAKNFIFNKPINLPNSITKIGDGFLCYNNKMVSEVNMNNILGTAFYGTAGNDNFNFMSSSKTVDSYTTGFKLVGTNAATVKTNNPNISLDNARGYRKWAS